MIESIRILEERKPYVIKSLPEFVPAPEFDPERVYNTFHVPAALRQTAYAINKRLRADHNAIEKAKQRARGIYARALKCGDLVRPVVCEKCGGGGRIDGHHVDYARPLAIEWLCRRCHPAADRRRQIREAGNDE